MSLKILGQYKGFIDLDLNTATVRHLKEAVSQASGLEVAGLKLLAGGKHLKDDNCILAQCGVTSGQKIIVLRQDLSDQMKAEESLNRRTEEVVQAVSMLSARAARDIDSGGRGNAWGDWRRGQGRGTGRGGRGAGRHIGGPQIELTNQDGEAIAIPPEDSAALMEGIMLHKKGLTCLKILRAKNVPSAKSPFAPREKLIGRERETSRSRGKISPPSVAGRSRTSNRGSSKEPKATAAGETAEGLDDGAAGGVEERKQNDSDRAVGAIETTKREGEHSMDEIQVEATADAGLASEASQSTAAQTSQATPEAKEESPGDSPGKGKEKLEVGTPRQRSEAAHVPCAPEKRLVQREALGLLLRAEEAFRRCKPQYRESVDNYAYLCLDIVWLLFLMKDMSNLDLATRMLEAVEVGFRNAHGPGLQRLTALKGEFCAEKLLYVRLHLLQGVVAFLQGNSGMASTLLIRASAEAKALRPNAALAARLVQRWRSVKLEPLEIKMAMQALRAGRNNLDAAWQYLEGLRQRQEIVKKEGERRRDARRAQNYGRTSDKKSFVDPALVAQLASGGFKRRQAVRALREHNNNIEAALASLTSISTGDEVAGSEESIAILESLGVPENTARDVLRRTGNLCDALSELGINASEAANIEAGVGESKRKDPRKPRGSGEGAGGSSGHISVESSEGESDESKEQDDQNEDAPAPTEGEMRLYDELVEHRRSEGEEGHLDVTLEDEADAADMYLYLCKGNIPLTFDLAKVRAGIAKVTVG